MKYTLILLSVFACISCVAQTRKSTPDNWRIALERKDGKEVVFLLEQKMEKGKTIFYVINAGDRIKITDVGKAHDSIFITMPAFEASFRMRKNANGSLSGTFIKNTSGSPQYWPVYGQPNNKVRFKQSQGNAKHNLTGKWNVDITRANGTLRKAIAVFKQTGNKLTGSFLTPSSDYRFLEGIVTGDSLKLSGFDGDNEQLFEAKIESDQHISGGVFYNGFTGQETWVAKKDPTVALPTISEPTRLREGQSKLNFTFNDLNGQPVSINDEKYKNKIVVVQIFGSWCANCLDETRFLSDYYNNNKPKDVEVISLAYEYTTDVARSKKSIEKFKNLFNVRYPMLITGATAGDNQKAEKTLPQLTAIKSFPTTIFIDKKGEVADIHTNFYGPGSGEYYELSKKRFFETVERLQKED